MLFYDWLHLHKIVVLIYAVTCISCSYFSLLSSMPLLISHSCLSYHLLTDILVSSLSGVTTDAESMCGYLCRHLFLFLLSKDQGVKRISHMLSICLTLEETAQLFSKAVVEFSIPASNAWGLQLHRVLATLGRATLSF